MSSERYFAAKKIMVYTCINVSPNKVGLLVKKNRLCLIEASIGAFHLPGKLEFGARNDIVYKLATFHCFNRKKGRWAWLLLLLAMRYVIVCPCESTKTTMGAPVDVAQHWRYDFLTTPKPEQVAYKQRNAQLSLNADEGGRPYWIANSRFFWRSD